MSKVYGKMRVAAFPVLVAAVILLLLSAASFAQGQRYKSNDAWAFGVMGDTQYTLGWPVADNPTFLEFIDPTGENPFYVTSSIARQINQQFINHNVKFAFALGDMANYPSPNGMAERAQVAQELYDAGIGFFPMRGNHETFGYLGAKYFGTIGGIDYDPDRNYTIPEIKANFPQTTGYAPMMFGAANFDTPADYNIDALSYSFDYNNARFVIIDPWATHTTGEVRYPDHTGNSISGVYWGYRIGLQQDWISERLTKSSTRPAQAFVLSHAPLLGANHTDSPFGGIANAFPDEQADFFSTLHGNDVKFYISAHDHIHNRSIIDSPTPGNPVQQLIVSGASTKFYTPGALNNPAWGGQKSREIQLSQDIKFIGYYIYTVDGPRVTVDYYSDDHGNWGSDFLWPEGTSCNGPDDCTDPGTLVTPQLNFARKETWGYSLNGKQFIVPQQGSYTVVQDRYQNTTAKILSGQNNSTAKDYTPKVIDDKGTPDDPSDDVVVSSPRPYSKAVNTGWAEKPAGDAKLLSPIFSLWGMSELGTEQTDTYALSMSIEFDRLYQLDRVLGIAALDAQGKWVNAVDLNFGGTKRFVLGPYNPSYGLGTFGVDVRNKNVWAVVNYNADFAVAKDIEVKPRR